MITLMDIKNYVKGKRIILVGNSDLLIKTDNSGIIDSYDVVVRMNHAVPQKNIGNKTDIWLCSFVTKELQLKRISQFNADINIRLNDDGNLDEALNDVFYIWPNKDRNKLRKIVESEYPSTGIMAVYFFINYCNCDITTIGYDNFATGTFYNSNKKMAKTWHNIAKEKEYMNDMIEQRYITSI